MFTALFVAAAMFVLFDYHRHYARFAREDPDRLQSEEYRHKLIAAQGLKEPMLADDLQLAGPARNPARGGGKVNGAQVEGRE